MERKNFIEKIVDRLTYHVRILVLSFKKFRILIVIDLIVPTLFCCVKDQIIIPLTTRDLKGKGKEDAEDEEDPLLVVHPNYVLDT